MCLEDVHGFFEAVAIAVDEQANVRWLGK
jgi:hypothetical protein